MDLGNAWADITRSVLYVLLPLSALLALLLVSQGVVQSVRPYVAVDASTESVRSSGSLAGRSRLGSAPGLQRLPLGPVASQVAIKQLGTNGGGYFGTNSSHPFENPTPISDFAQCLSILLIPAALCFAFGHLVKDHAQGRALFAACAALFVLLLGATYMAERAGNPLLLRAGLDSATNWEGKETRIGIAASTLWASATTAASNGSVNCMHDSLTPLGGLFPMFLMQLGEVVFGGVGTGLTGLLAFVLVAVFVAGLMVGRTPEYLGKKIEALEMKWCVSWCSYRPQPRSCSQRPRSWPDQAPARCPIRERTASANSSTPTQEWRTTTGRRSRDLPGTRSSATSWAPSRCSWAGTG